MNLTPNFKDYELIDSGEGEKLERFGRYTLRRPEPQAVWRKSLDEKEWQRLADASFLRTDRSEERGEWRNKPQMKDRWNIRYDYKDMHLTMRLACTAFKHIGVFPEQAANWNFIYDTCRAKIERKEAKPKVLNLFAYTGGATLAAAASGAEVTHVDSVKQVVTWSRENMESSNLDGIRWIVEDALKFVQREVRRGNRYDGIILDPPAYGRGANGEKWVLEQNIAEMLEACAQLLAEDGFLVLNLYSMGLSSTIARTLVHQMFGAPAKEEFGELYFTDRAGKELPFGTFYRMERKTENGNGKLNNMVSSIVIFALASGILLDVLVGLLGSRRNIGFGWAFLISVIFTPLIGLIVVLISNPLPAGAEPKYGCLGYSFGCLGTIFIVLIATAFLFGAISLLLPII